MPFQKGHKLNNGKKFTEEHKKKIGDANRGNKHSEEAKRKIGLAGVGRLVSKETREKKSEIAKRLGIKPPVMYGKDHPNWKGGATSEAMRVRNSLEYKAWRNEVFERDNYTCVECGIRGGDLNADHIQPFSMYPELRLDLDNGRTFCLPCHEKVGWSLFRENNPRKYIAVRE